MSKTIVLDDATYAALKAALGVASTPDTPDAPAPETRPTEPAPPTLPPGSLNLGEFKLDGTSRLASQGFANQLAIASFVVPDLPGKLVEFSVFEYGGPMTWRRCWLSKTPGDLTAKAPYYRSDSGCNFQGYIVLPGQAVPFGYCEFHPGERWYVMVKNEKPFGGSSCPSGTCDIGIKGYYPK